MSRPKKKEVAKVSLRKFSTNYTDDEGEVVGYMDCGVGTALFAIETNLRDKTNLILRDDYTNGMLLIPPQVLAICVISISDEGES